MTPAAGGFVTPQVDEATFFLLLVHAAAALAAMGLRWSPTSLVKTPVAGTSPNRSVFVSRSCRAYLDDNGQERPHSR